MTTSLEYFRLSTKASKILLSISSQLSSNQIFQLDHLEGKIYLKRAKSRSSVSSINFFRTKINHPVYVTHPLDSCCVSIRVSTPVVIISTGILPSQPCRFAQSRSVFQRAAGRAGVVSHLWRSNCEPHCFSVVCNSLVAAGVAGGRLTKLENNEPAGKQCRHNGTARSLPFHPR